MIELRAVKGKTGRLLATLLAEKGVRVNEGEQPTSGIISYGVTVRDVSVPVLNANAGKLDKFQELQALAKAKIAVPNHSTNRGDISGAVLGRMYKHAKGKDIRLVVNSYDSSSNYYTRYVQVSREYRVWTFRNRVLGVYEKVLRYPKKAKKRPGVAWNWARGYAFQFYREAPVELGQLGIKAVAAVGLDFGAVDIVEDAQGHRFVLEVNSAPGTQDRRQGLTYLATKIARWCENGFKKRKEATIA